ncbi:hypothetical protein M9Y10_008302 [Tritrichomonas musculus]|uniref:Uncharacterized protein n=1 Tax=Tritrichomonas musculus TaxID=1915356 RepID=A0ABR2IYS3_9EUKA
MNIIDLDDDDPFLAISDDSENDQAIKDVNAFLNAPSSVVVQKKNNSTNPTSTSITSTPVSDTKPASLSTHNQHNSPKKSSINIDSSVFELPSFDSPDSSENIGIELNSISTKKNSNSNRSQNNNYGFNESKPGSNTPTFSPKNNLKRSPYPKKNLISNQDLINAFFFSDEKNNNEPKNEATQNKEKNEATQNKEKNETNNDDTQKSKEKINEKDSKPQNKDNDKKEVQSPRNIFKDLDLDATEIDVGNDQSKSVHDEPKNSIVSDKSHIQPPKYKPPSYNRSHQYISPKTPIEYFEYSFIRYLEDASDDLRATFNDEFQLILSEIFDFQNKIQTFIFDLNQEIRTILDNEASTFALDSNHIEYDTDYISYFFQNLSSSLKRHNFQTSNYTENSKFTFKSPSTGKFKTSNFSIMDLNDIEINADFIQSLKSSIIKNSKLILSDLQNNLSELSNLKAEFNKSEEIRIQNIYRQKMQARYVLEAQELQINMERSNVNKKLENLKEKMDLLISNDLFAIPPYMPSQTRLVSPDFTVSDDSSFDLNGEIEETIEKLKKIDTKKVTSPITSFSNKVKSIGNDVLILNSQLSGKAVIVSRSLSLVDGHKQIPYMASAITPNQRMQIHRPPIMNSNFLNVNEYNNSDSLFQASSINDLNNINNINYSPSRSQIVNGVRQRLSDIKKDREEQIAEVHQLIYDNQ